MPAGCLNNTCLLSALVGFYCSKKKKTGADICQSGVQKKKKSNYVMLLRSQREVNEILTICQCAFVEKGKVRVLAHDH